jgi:hypothetical protein
MIARPQTYADVAEHSLDYSKILKDLDKYFDKKLWSIREFTIPRSFFRANFETLELQKRDEFLSKIKYAMMLIVKDIDNNCGYLGFVEFIDDNLVKEINEVWDSVFLEDLNKMQNSMLIKIKDIQAEKLPSIQAEIARKISFTQISQDKGAQQIENIGICRNNICMGIEVGKDLLSNERIFEIAEEIFKRYEEAKSSAKQHENISKAFCLSKIGAEFRLGHRGNQYRPE